MDTQSRIICRSCGDENLPIATYCHRCGAALNAPEIVGNRPPTAPTSPVVEYRSMRIERDPNWTTVANFQYCGEIHAARALLSHKEIVSRIGPSPEGSSEFDLQVPSTQAEWAREILTRQVPQAVMSAGFPVITAANSAASQQVRPLPVPVISLAPGAGPSGASYYLIMAALWILMLLIILGMVWVAYYVN